jgi:hypothetical protein
MRILLLVSILLLTFTSVRAQEEAITITTYIRKDGELCSKSKAVYIRKIVMEESVYRVKEYDLKGNLFMDARCSSVIPMIFDGLCTYYYENGQKRMETMFVNNRSSTWGYWAENGESLSSKLPSSSLVRDTTIFRMDLSDEKSKAAAYPGGNQAMAELIKATIQYPGEIAWRNISDRMLIYFTIDTTGKVNDIFFNQRMGPDFEDQITKLFHSMPLFIPATYDGKKVKTFQILPVSFNLRSE